jgi:hypothetical protein
VVSIDGLDSWAKREGDKIHGGWGIVTTAGLGARDKLSMCVVPGRGAVGLENAAGAIGTWEVI